MGTGKYLYGIVLLTEVSDQVMAAFEMGEQYRIRNDDRTAVQQNGVRLHAVAGGEHELDSVEITDSTRLVRAYDARPVNGGCHMEVLFCKSRMEKTVFCHMC